MQCVKNWLRTRQLAPPSFLLTVAVSLFVARDAPARPLPVPRLPIDTPLVADARDERVAGWAAALEPIEIANASTAAVALLRLYDRTGEIEKSARCAFEQIASRNTEPHALSVRVEQLAFKAAYHFGAHRIQVVSGWRERGGKHSTGDALDFRLDGVRAGTVAAFLRTLPRVGVGIYTHPSTQFVHVDIRDASYAWLDASPPGIHWKERPIGVSHATERDASYTPESDLPL